MVITNEQLTEITEFLSKKFDPDIAHDVAVVLLRRRNPLTDPRRYAHAFASALAHRRKTMWHKPKLVNFTDLGSSITQKMVDYGLL